MKLEAQNILRSAKAVLNTPRSRALAQQKSAEQQSASNVPGPSSPPKHGPGSIRRARRSSSEIMQEAMQDAGVAQKLAAMVAKQESPTDGSHGMPPPPQQHDPYGPGASRAPPKITAGAATGYETLKGAEHLVVPPAPPAPPPPTAPPPSSRFQPVPFLPQQQSGLFTASNTVPGGMAAMS